jgi:hypothetical protein
MSEKTVELEGCILFENGVKVFYPLPIKAPPTPSLYSSHAFQFKKTVKFARFTQEFPPLPELKENDCNSVESVESAEERILASEPAEATKGSPESNQIAVAEPTEATKVTLKGEEDALMPIPPIRSDSLNRFVKPSFLNK